MIHNSTSIQAIEVSSDADTILITAGIAVIVVIIVSIVALIVFISVKLGEGDSVMWKIVNDVREVLKWLCCGTCSNKKNAATA